MQCHIELGVLAGQFGRTVLGGECNLYEDFVAHLGADQLLLETRNEHTATKFHAVSLGFAPRKLLAIDAADEINDDHVAILRRPFAAYSRCCFMLIGDTAKRVVNFRVLNRRNQALQFQLGEIHRRDFRQHFDRNCVLQIRAVFVGRDFYLRLAGRAHTLFGQRLLRRIIDRALQHLAHDRRPVALPQQ